MNLRFSHFLNCSFRTRNNEHGFVLDFLKPLLCSSYQNVEFLKNMEHVLFVMGIARLVVFFAISFSRKKRLHTE
jgi:hypothetical protein